MSDFERLERKLNKLRQRERPPGERRILRGTPEQLLAGVVTEFDETILPRRLTFSCENGPVFHFAVANRRLQALLSPAPPVEGAAGLADRPLADAGDADVSRLREVLLRGLSGSDSVTLGSARPAEPVFASDIGVPVEQLRRAWEIAGENSGARGAAENIATFVEGLGEKAIAWLRIEGENVAGQGGNPSALAAIGDHAAIFLDGYLARRDQIFQGEAGPVALLLAGKGAGTALLFLDAGGQLAFVLVPVADAGGAMRDWQRRVLG